jgi:hypothetical protein
MILTMQNRSLYFQFAEFRETVDPRCLFTRSFHRVAESGLTIPPKMAPLIMPGVGNTTTAQSGRAFPTLVFVGCQDPGSVSPDLP